MAGQRTSAHRKLLGDVFIEKSKVLYPDQLAYETEVLSEDAMKLDEAYELGQFILSEASSYRPRKRFAGHTECFKSKNANLFIEILTSPEA